MQNYTFRLASGQDLFDSIQALVREKQVEAACFLTGVGSLTHAAFRLANRGTLPAWVSSTYFCGDEHGKTIGGHLGSRCTVYTTAEIVIAVFDEMVYKRKFAEDSGYEELAVYRR